MVIGICLIVLLLVPDDWANHFTFPGQRILGSQFFAFLIKGSKSSYFLSGIIDLKLLVL